MKKLFMVLGSMTALAIPAQAGLMLEPYLGYETSTVSATGTVGGVAGIPMDQKNTGTTMIGGRIGYKLLIPIWIAADVSTGSGTYKYDAALAGATLGDVSFTRMNTYATVGFDFPILFRAWLGIGVGNKTTVKDNSGSSDVKGGSSQKLGLGLTFLPMISVNVEYFTNKPDMPSSAITKYEETGLQVGLSLPLDL